MNANSVSRPQPKSTEKGNQEQLSNDKNSILHAFIWPEGASSLHLYGVNREALPKIESPNLQVTATKIVYNFSYELVYRFSPKVTYKRQA
jgi:hypothetical protein